MIPVYYFRVLRTSLLPREVRLGCQIPLTRIIDGCESPCVQWELNPGLLF